VFHFHGVPGSRLEARLLASVAEDVGVRLIAVDRPGMGLSDFLPDRRIRDWPADVAALADALGLDKFIVEGFSGGGSYAAVCAVYLPERINACGLISSAGPKGIELEGQCPLGSPSASALWKIMDSSSRAWSGFARGCRDLASAQRFVEQGLDHIFPGGRDAELGHDQTVQSIFAIDFHEAFRQGIEGEVHEDYLRNIPWDFNLAGISSQVPVFLWHGERDGNVPCCVGKSIAQVIKHCRPTFYPEEGHISVLRYHGTEILRALLSH
jgi:pimeloyl-ACP methyl ester carboxylesterase